MALGCLGLPKSMSWACLLSSESEHSLSEPPAVAASAATCCACLEAGAPVELAISMAMAAARAASGSPRPERCRWPAVMDSAATLRMSRPLALGAWGDTSTLQAPLTVEVVPPGATTRWAETGGSHTLIWSAQATLFRFRGSDDMAMDAADTAANTCHEAVTQPSPVNGVAPPGTGGVPRHPLHTFGDAPAWFGEGWCQGVGGVGPPMNMMHMSQS